MIIHPLRLTVPFHSDESPASFVSRLAARNGTVARTLCHDFDLRFQDVVDGRDGALRRVALLAGIDAGPLLANAFVKSAPLQWTYRGQVLHRIALRRERIAICPACALADIEAAPMLRASVAVRGRAKWLVEVVKTCPDHRLPLVVASEGLQPNHLHDFAHHVAAVLPRLRKLAAVPSRDPGPLETYALARLDGHSASPLLDPMPLAAAVRLCETAGAVALFGPKVDLKRLSGDDRHTAGERGFESIAGGQAALRTFLDGLLTDVGPRARLDGPGVAFGRLFNLLRITRNDPDFDAVRDIIRGHIVDNFALPHGHDILGKPIGQRRIHTVHTLAKETAVHPKTLRKHLRAAGLLTEAQMAMSDHNVRIDADQAIDIAQQLAGTLSLAEAMEHLNVPRAQMDVLIKAGIVAPQERVTGFGAQNRYTVADLDGLLARLTPKARRAGRDRGKLCTIPEAAKRCCCSAADILRLVLDGKVRTTKIHTRGYMGVLVDPIAVLKAVRGPDPGGLPLRQAAREIGTSDRVLDALIAHGHIASFTGVNPVNWCPQTLVAPKEIKRFKAKYVSLWALSKQHGVHITTMKVRLDVADVKPALDPVAIGARFYRRRRVVEVERNDH